jgi:hypothetical protein
MPDLVLGIGKAMKSVSINRAFCIMPTLNARAFVGKFANSFSGGGGGGSASHGVTEPNAQA